MSHPDATKTSDPESAADSTENPRFVAGTMLAGRYRIVTMLGRGGMGEVYKADDLKLGQPVAIKFLPGELGLQSAALARFHREARIARQVSHPHVCRVYDVGEIDGLHFLTMEFIDGEDLASLLRRIGRLPRDKAVDIARQLCAGLAAAHDAGVIHRDLKPANLMIDSRGRARITDFGIAALVQDLGNAVRAGTPAYMAPEQLSGQVGTTRSDIYALGLVLHEIFTGTRFTAGASDLDAELAVVIGRCLDKDPERRPASAVLVSAALPGADPLQAALAAGELPSPEMIAASGALAAVRPGIAIALALLTGVMLVGGAWLRTQVNIAAQVAFENSPEVLAHKAREMLERLGYVGRDGDRAFGFTYNYPFIQSAGNGDAGARRRRVASDRSQAVLFWYRESPDSMAVAVRPEVGRPPRVGPVAVDNPPLAVPGMRLLVLDLNGRLVRFRAVSPEFGPLHGEGTITASQILAAAGVEAQNFAPDAPTWTPPVAADARVAWKGAYPDEPGQPVRLEAGTLRGVLTAFETIEPWQANAGPPADRSQSPRSGTAVAMLSSVLILVGAALAWRNVRTGRGDRRGALRIAALLVALRFTAWALNTDHVLTSEELSLLRLGMGEALFDGFATYVMYLALEPYIRLWWPQVLVGWNRLLSSGRFRDPHVGYEILVGLALATTAAAVNLAVIYSMSGLTTTTDLNALQSIRRVGASLVRELNEGLFSAVTLAFLVSLLRQLLRREWLAAAAFIGIFALVVQSSIEPFVGAWWSGILMGSILGIAAVVAITRFGLVALASFYFTWTFLQQAPALLRPSAWYSGVSLFVFAALLGIATWCLYVAITSSQTSPIGFSHAGRDGAKSRGY
jgi:serine/threonine-protein kinase